MQATTPTDPQADNAQAVASTARALNFNATRKQGLTWKGEALNSEVEELDVILAEGTRAPAQPHYSFL
eukprot:5618201-Amphidinium_carterae.2